MLGKVSQNACNLVFQPAGLLHGGASVTGESVGRCTVFFINDKEQEYMRSEILFKSFKKYTRGWFMELHIF
jgi:hypothetical protein